MNFLSIHTKIIALIFMMLLPISMLSASDGFCAWELKSGHQGIIGAPLTFTEKSVTIELWLNMAEGQNEIEKATVLGTMDNNNRGALLSVRKNDTNNNELELRFFAINPQKTSVVFFIPLNEITEKWGHLAFVISEEDNKAYAYLNGDLYASTDIAGGWIGNSTIPLSIGSWYNDPKFYGKIADVRVWKSARNAEEIKQNYNKHLEEITTDLVLNYQFSTYEKDIANLVDLSQYAICKPEENWNYYHGHEMLVQKPTNISIKENQLTWTGQNTLVSDSLVDGNYIVKIEPETEKNLRNPLTGWVLYGSPGSASDFWTKLDNITVPGYSTPVKIADYANTLYIRTSWTALNPSEGVYGWDTNAGLKWMIDNAQQRGMRLAFRVVVDSRDKSEDFTPRYVRDAGAEGFTSGSNNQRWSPYPDDPIFQAKYEKFVEAFALKFNDPNQVDFIDGFGLGLWGEAHNMKYKHYSNRENVFKWVVDLYTRCFTKIPLAINYHRLIATEQSWGAADKDSERLLKYAFDKGYILRQDAFGMTDYYQQWERNIAAKWLFKRPIIMEGGWVTNSHRWWNDPRGYETLADVRQGEFDDSKEAHVNMMDFRINEVETWFNSSFDLVKKFIAEGGYRLYPDKISLPAEVDRNSLITISHQWNNLGWGYCPTNLSVWNQKYKVAFGLMDEQGDIVASFVDTQTDLSTWLKDNPMGYDFSFLMDREIMGKFTWVVAIVDVTNHNNPGVMISAKDNITNTGWLRLFDVVIK